MAARARSSVSATPAPGSRSSSRWSSATPGIRTTRHTVRPSPAPIALQPTPARATLHQLLNKPAALKKLAWAGPTDLEAKVNGRTALSQACVDKEWHAARLLIKAGASITARDRDGEVPLHAAVRADDSSFVSDLLLAHQDVDIGVNLQNHRGMTPLHIAARRGLVDCARRLVAAGADPQSTDEEGDTPLHAAIRHGHNDCLDAILSEARPTVTVVDAEGDSVLHEAVRCFNADAVRLLLDHKAIAASVANNRKRTPLHSAALRGLVDVVRLLLDAGADPFTADVDGDTPLADAMKHEPTLASEDAGGSDHAGCVALLLEATKDVCTLCPDKQLLYVPFSPGVGAPTPSASRTGPRANSQPTPARINLNSPAPPPQSTKKTPSTRAKATLNESFAPGADCLDCSICMMEVRLRPQKCGGNAGGSSSSSTEAAAAEDDGEYDQAAVTACGHLFHLECWQQVIAHAGTGGVNCPNCREKLTLRRATPLSPPPIVPTPRKPLASVTNLPDIIEGLEAEVAALKLKKNGKEKEEEAVVEEVDALAAKAADVAVQFVCECGKNFGTEHGLKVHRGRYCALVCEEVEEEGAAAEQFVCACGQTFETEHGYKVHRGRYCTVVACKCGQKFETEHGLKVHKGRYCTMVEEEEKEEKEEKEEEEGAPSGGGLPSIYARFEQGPDGLQLELCDNNTGYRGVMFHNGGMTFRAQYWMHAGAGGTKSFGSTHATARDAAIARARGIAEMSAFEID